MSCGVLIYPTDDQIVRARQLYDFGALRNSITRGAGNLIGAVGEVCFGDYCPSWRKVESYSHDFIRDDGKTVDVKSTDTTVPPRPDYAAKVAETSTHQKPDIYVFTRVHKNLNSCWLLGWLPREEFFDLAIFRKKGEKDPNGDGWPEKASCWNVYISQLRDVNEL